MRCHARRGACAHPAPPPAGSRRSPRTGRRCSACWRWGSWRRWGNCCWRTLPTLTQTPAACR
jgi:hypothetical protein